MTATVILDTPRCGTRSQYTAGCRCLPCRVANTEYKHGLNRWRRGCRCETCCVAESAWSVRPAWTRR